MKLVGFLPVSRRAMALLKARNPKLVQRPVIVHGPTGNHTRNAWVLPEEAASENPRSAQFDLFDQGPEPAAARNEDAIRMYTDALDTIGDDPERAEQRARYIAKLKDMGVEYKRKPTGMEVDPAQAYSPDDFATFREYRAYADRRFSYLWKEKNLAQYAWNPGTSRKAADAELKALGDALGIKFTVKDRVSGTETAFVSGDDEVFLSRKDLDHAMSKHVLIHEMGHVFDNRYVKSADSPAKDIASSPSAYGTMNGGEAFAESFLAYFGNPDLLKAVNPEGYRWLDSRIPQEWKQAISGLLEGKDNARQSMKNYGWDAAKLSEAYSLEELDKLRLQVEDMHRLPANATRKTIWLYDVKGRKKLDAIAWAITYKLKEEKGRR